MRDITIKTLHNPNVFVEIRDTNKLQVRKVLEV